MTILASLYHPDFKEALSLKRQPLFLRFTRLAGQWDALDLLDDQPEPGETIIAGRLFQTQSVHLDRRDKSGRRFGEWYRHATYHVYSRQPDDATARDSDAWAAWCNEQLRNEADAQ